MYKQVEAQLSDAQHGFRKGRGTTDNLLSLMATVIPAVDAGTQVDVAYLDFKKAFDTVDNDILLEKLGNVGCTPHTLTFIADYLRNRRQYVDCGGCLSEPYYTLSGVNQGSNLGPLQFIIMINDLQEAITDSTCLLFADDLKLVCEIRHQSDCDGLQRSIDEVTKWSHDNKLFFNVSKCSVMSFSRASAPLQREYRMEGEPLPRVTEMRDLGVRFTQDLRFRGHIEEVVKKAFRNLGFVLRQSQEFTKTCALRALYDALVKSHLEYCSIIWAPSEAKYRLMVEKIQNKFTRFMYKKFFGVYPGFPLLYPSLFVNGMVGYSTLQARRDLAMGVYLWKVLRGEVHNPAVLARLQLCVPPGGPGRRRLPPLLAVPAARTNLLRDAPLTRGMRLINTLASSIDIFGCSLSEFTVAFQRELYT